MLYRYMDPLGCSLPKDGLQKLGVLGVGATFSWPPSDTSDLFPLSSACGIPMQGLGFRDSGLERRFRV